MKDKLKPCCSWTSTSAVKGWSSCAEEPYRSLLGKWWSLLHLWTDFSVWKKQLFESGRMFISYVNIWEVILNFVKSWPINVGELGIKKIWIWLSPLDTDVMSFFVFALPKVLFWCFSEILEILPTINLF